MLTGEVGANCMFIELLTVMRPVEPNSKADTFTGVTSCKSRHQIPLPASLCDLNMSWSRGRLETTVIEEVFQGSS